jgi:hypothetical protein
MNDATKTRPVLDAVRRLCKRYGCTPLYVRHNGKSERRKAMHTALGSIDITAHMRSELTIYKDPDVPSRRILAHTKSNGCYGPSMQFNLVGVPYTVLHHDEDGKESLTVEDVRVDWDGRSEWTSDDLNARESVHGNDTAEANTALDEARAFLLEMLKDGPQLVDEIHAQAKQAGITASTLRRGKAKEKIKARRQPTDDKGYTKSPWVWHLPGDPTMST